MIDPDAAGSAGRSNERRSVTANLRFVMLDDPGPFENPISHKPAFEQAMLAQPMAWHGGRVGSTNSPHVQWHRAHSPPPHHDFLIATRAPLTSSAMPLAPRHWSLLPKACDSSAAAPLPKDLISSFVPIRMSQLSQTDWQLLQIVAYCRCHLGHGLNAQVSQLSQRATTPLNTCCNGYAAHRGSGCTAEAVWGKAVFSPPGNAPTSPPKMLAISVTL